MNFFIISNFAKPFTYVSDLVWACQKYPLNHSGCHPHNYTEGKKTMYQRALSVPPVTIAQTTI